MKEKRTFWGLVKLAGKGITAPLWGPFVVMLGSLRRVVRGVQWLHWFFTEGAVARAKYEAERVRRIRAASRNAAPGWSELMQAWAGGATRHDLRRLKTALRGHLAAWSFVFVLGSYVLYTQPSVWRAAFYGLLLIIVGVMGILVTAWKMYVLRLGCYIPFSVWMLGRAK